MTEHIVPAGVPAMPIERYLRRAWPMMPAHVARDIVRRRDVRINGARADGSAAVRGGDRLAVFADARWLSPPADILWSDGRLIVAVKPQGLPVDVDRDGIGADTLLNRLRAVHPGAQLCHRLDAQTGGIVLAAADDRVYAQALGAFRAHAIEKTYRALALGAFERPSGTLHAYLYKDARRAEVRILHAPGRGALPIETRYRAGEEVAPGVFDVALQPVTGRTHQLRAHMASFGHPLLGDDRYGDREANRRFHTGLCLWHQHLRIPEDSPLVEYRGRAFEAPAPAWLRK